MTKLTDTQLIVLSSACRRDDGLAVRPANLKPGAALKVATALAAKGFVREIRAKLDAPVWREDESGRFALKILKAGKDVIGVEDAAVASEEPAPMRTSGAKERAAPTPVSPNKVTPSGSSKREQVIALLERRQGATMEDLIAATNWLPHTTRAVLCGLRKGGFAVERTKSETSGASVYRIVGAANVAAAAAA